MSKPSSPLAFVKKLFGFGPKTPDTAGDGRFYDPATDTWNNSPNMNELRAFVPSGAIGDSLIIAAGQRGSAPLRAWNRIHLRRRRITDADANTSPTCYQGHPTAQPGHGQRVPRTRQRSCVMASPRLPPTSTCSAVWIMAQSRAPLTAWISPLETGNPARRALRR